MGLFGGSSSKSTASAAETGQQVEDKGLALSIAGSKFKKSNVTINTTDLGSVDQSFDLADSALGLVGDSTRNALEFGAGALTAAVDTSNESRRDALEFGAGAFTGALGAVERSSAQAFQASQQAMADSAASRRDALEFGAGAFSSALAAVDAASDEAMSAASAAYNASSGQISHFAQQAIDKVSDQAKSEASKGFELLLKLVAGVLVVGAGAWVLRGAK